jgi:hypothetical protein
MKKTVKEYEYIRIIDVGTSKSGLTKRFVVESMFKGGIVGMIKYKANWRKYAFFPVRDSYFEEVCLYNLASFVNAINYKLKNERKNKK